MTEEIRNAAVAQSPVPDSRPSEMQFFSFIEELSEPLQKLLTKAWEARGKLIRDVVAYFSMGTTMIISMPGRTVRVVNNPKLWALIAEEEDPEALAFVLVGTGSAMSMGSAGAAFGLTVGGTAGAALGALPALFTFGLSIPVGAIVGSAGGLLIGSTAGGSVGFVGGGATAYALASARHSMFAAYNKYILHPANRVKEGALTLQRKTQEAKEAVVENVSALASNGSTQIILASAGGGALLVGTAGAGCGTVVGATTGALVGVVPAIFTFGLSIPVGAVLGGAGGLCMGTAAGSTIGAVGGGGASALVLAMDKKWQSWRKGEGFSVMDGHAAPRRQGSTGSTN